MTEEENNATHQGSGMGGNNGGFNIQEDPNKEQTNAKQERKSLEDVLGDDIIEDELPGGKPVYEVLENIDRKLNNQADLSPKKRALLHDKILAKTYGVKYGFLKEKLYDGLYQMGINKYQQDLKNELKQFDEQVLKYKGQIDKLKFSIEGAVGYTPKMAKESLEDFVKRIKRIPEKKKGIEFKYEFSKEMASIAKNQYLFYDSKEKNLEVMLGEKRVEYNELDKQHSNEGRKMLNDVNGLEKELHEVRKHKEQTQNKFETFYAATKRTQTILRRNELILKNVESYINKVKANKEILESYLGGGDDLQLIYKLDHLSRDISDRSKNFADIVDLASGQTKDSLDFINNVPTIDNINGNDLGEYLDSMEQKTRTYDSNDIMEKARELGI